MSFRTVVITNQCKLSYKNDYLVVRSETTTMIHLSEIEMIIVDTTAVSITAYLINELIQHKINLVFCDEQHNPCSNTLPIYGSHNTSKKIKEQTCWSEEAIKYYWTNIVKIKIYKQSELLKLNGHNDTSYLLLEYVDQMNENDSNNTEGHAARVYFNSLFGPQFSRDLESPINAALNYGYALLLSTFNKEIISNGYLTELGIGHRNEFNFFNLSCDLMEPFRPLIDQIVVKMSFEEFDNTVKYNLIDLLNKEVTFRGSRQYVSNVIKVYTREVLEGLSTDEHKHFDVYDFV